jgi:ribosomal protein S18 acetylase RimI-like enzyme
MPTQTHPTIAIREATDDDISYCAELRAAYTTDAVWQLQRNGETAWSKHAAGHAPLMHGTPMLNFHLQQVRLPRTRRLLLPSAAVPLEDAWNAADLRLVALHNDNPCGYLLIQVLPDQQQGMINRLVVDEWLRRKKLGRSLVRAARAWARLEELNGLTAHVPVRNVGGVAFYQHCGFHLSGLLERFYPTHENALLLSRAV